MKLRYTFKELDALKHQSLTIFTFGSYTKKKKTNDEPYKEDDILPGGKIESRLFMEIASAVLQSGLDGGIEESKSEIIDITV